MIIVIRVVVTAVIFGTAAVIITSAVIVMRDATDHAAETDGGQ
jgi:hypothetical protein